jgi:hypothetical protein
VPILPLQKQKIKTEDAEEYYNEETAEFVVFNRQH